MVYPSDDVTVQSKSNEMNSIVVFCGSSSGTDPAYSQVAATVGQTLATRNIRLVYGGAQVGLMGSVAEACLSASGYVIGVIPRFLARKEIVHGGLSELVYTETMHERKAQMSQLSEGCIALPGGYGTLEELFELLTDAQLAKYSYPIGLLNVEGYYDKLLAFLDDCVANGLLRAENKDMLLVDTEIDGLLDQMVAFVPAPVPKWLQGD